MKIRIIAFKCPILHSFRSETFLLRLRVRIMSSCWKAQLSHQVSLDGWEERCCWYERAAVWRCRSRYEWSEVLFPAQCRVAWKVNEFHRKWIDHWDENVLNEVVSWLSPWKPPSKLIFCLGTSNVSGQSLNFSLGCPGQGWEEGQWRKWETKRCEWGETGTDFGVMRRSDLVRRRACFEVRHRRA